MTVFEHLDQQYPSQCHKFDRFSAEYKSLSHLPGNFAEFGVGNGGGARELAKLDPNRAVYAFDTYKGMPAEEYHPDEDSANPPGKWAPLAPAELLFSGIPNIIPVRGRFAWTLPWFIGAFGGFLLVHVDCDYYESYRQVLHFLEDRMVEGGVVFLDDYGGECSGCTRAVDEWIKWMGFLRRGHGDCPRVRRDGDKIYFLSH